MNFDKTFISIRKRSVSELFDLALTVVRGHWAALLILLVIGCLPWIAIDLWLLWPLMNYPVDDTARWTCSWLMMLLVVNQAQYGTSLLTIYLGAAMFEGQPDWRSIAKRAFRNPPLFVWLHGIVRMVVPVALLTFAIDFYDSSQFGVMMGLVIPGVVLLGMLGRAYRPFVTEMLLLEKTPLRGKDKNAINFSRRSKSLHYHATSELFGRFVMSFLFAVPLAISVQSMFVSVDTMFNLAAGNDWTLASYYWIASLWLTAGFICVFRFLSYIDIRIRQEGWAIELRMRVEGQKLSEAAPTATVVAQ